MKPIWCSWEELKQMTDSKQLFFWGNAEEWIPKTVRHFNHIEWKAIIDENPLISQKGYEGLPIFSPEKLLEIPKDEIFIIITSGLYEEASIQLSSMGFEGRKHFCCSPAMRDWVVMHNRKNYDQNIILTSPDSPIKGAKRYSKSGGGIYLFNTKENAIEKKIAGFFREIIRVDDNYYAVESEQKKVIVFSKSFERLGDFPIDQSEQQNEPKEACGLAYAPKQQLFFTTNTVMDSIHVYENGSFKNIATLNPLSNVPNSLHHINDMCIMKNNLVFSYFSFSGNWRQGIMDGGIAMLSLDDLSAKPTTLVRDLWMPHSVKFINGKVCYLNSMPGDLWIGNQNVEGSFPGFVRGLAYDNQYYYVGLTDTMYASRLTDIRNNTMCNTGFFLFDSNLKTSRFYSTPDLMNIHSLLVEA